LVHFPVKSAYNVNDLVELIEILRSPEGCPWDREQTHESIRRNLLEEAYEAAEAIDCNDTEHLREELGDVLMQVIFHASIEKQNGNFDLNSVADGTVRKLLYRHPHVFADVEANNSAEVLSNWDKLKQAERQELTLHDTLNNVARSLPALWRTEKLIGKAAKADFPVERAELTGTINEEIIGDELFKLAALAGANGIDPELALQNACERFIAKTI